MGYDNSMTLDASMWNGSVGGRSSCVINNIPLELIFPLTWVLYPMFWFYVLIYISEWRFELPCYPQFELEIHIVKISYFTNILIKLSGLWWSTLFYRLLQHS